MRVYIAEKPSMAGEIAKCLPGKLEKKDGCYRGSGTEVVTWLFGHVLTMAEPQDYNPGFKDWKQDDLPIVPSEWRMKVSPSCEKQFYIVKELIRQADEIVHVGDPDREGRATRF